MFVLIWTFCLIFLLGFFMGFCIGKIEGRRNLSSIPFSIPIRKITIEDIRNLRKKK